ncbi:hypothetical protein ACP3P8_15705 [Pseudomonas aeruginosa]
MRGERGLADAAFLVENREDHGAALRLEPACFCISCRLVVVRRSGALLKVMYLLLGKLNGPQSQQRRGFVADFVA